MLYIFNANTALIQQYDDEDYLGWSVLPRRDVVLLELLSLGHRIALIGNELEVGEAQTYPQTCHQKYNLIMRNLGLPFKHVVLNPTSLHYHLRSALLAWVCMDVLESDAPWNRADQSYRALPAPIMLIEAMCLMNSTTEQIVLVGGSEEDEQAARNAMCGYEWAEKFFYRKMEPEAPDTEAFP